MSAPGEPSPIDRARTPKSAELIASDLRRRIAEGRLLPGDSLPAEHELCEMFGVSRPTLREALRVLESQGMVSTRRGSRSGVSVQAPTMAPAALAAGAVLGYRNATLVDVYEAQELLEPGAAGRLASVATPADLRVLWQAVDNDCSDDRQPGLDLHCLLIDLGGNETIKAMAELVRPVLERTGWSCLEREQITDEQRERWRGAHRQVVEFIDAHDIDAAELAWRTHLVEMNAVFDSGPITVLDVLDPPRPRQQAQTALPPADVA